MFDDGTTWSLADLMARYVSDQETAGSDRINGSNLGDTVDAGDGDDIVSDGSGSDTITGGKGNDRLQGGSGADTYIYNIGDGDDVIYDYQQNDNSATDRLVFGSGITAADLRFSRDPTDGSDVVITFKGFGGSILLDNQEWSDAGIEQIAFADGTTLSKSQMTQLLQSTVIDGAAHAVTMGSDTINGSAGADQFRGMGGDDVLRGGTGSDTYTFARGDGYDTIYDPLDTDSTDRLVLEGINPSDVRVMSSPTDSDDIILYIDDDSIIYLDQQRVGASSGIEQVQFADGTIWSRETLASFADGGLATPGDDTLIGTNFADTLAGGTGNDTLIGGAGGDTYRYALGDGDDTIVDDNSTANQAGSETVASPDVLVLGAGIALSDLRLNQLVDDGPLVISFSSGPGSITLQGEHPGGLSGVELIQFADGSTITMADLRAMAINSAATSGSDVLRGFDTDDNLDGGAGNDTLAGGKGNDTYRFDVGDGSDTIVETSDGSHNTLVFGSGITASDVRLSRLADAPDDLILSLANGSDSVTLRDQFANGAAAGLQEIRFADGTIWLAQDFDSMLLAQPASANDDYLVGDDSDNVIDGLAGDDNIIGGAGADTIYGSDGNDTIFGGTGDDVLYGGAGDDVLSGDTGTDLLDGGDGFDIADYSFSQDRWSIDLSAGTASITTTDLSDLTESLIGIEGVIGGLGSDHIIGDDNSNRLQGGGGYDQLAGAGGDDVFIFDGDGEGVDAIDGGSGLDRIEAASDGTVIGLSAVTGIEVVTSDGYADVTIAATDGADTLDLSNVELDGITSIQMGGGDDVIAGSLGADVIAAGDGDDVIRFLGASTGADQIDGGAGNDTIAAGADNTVIRISSISGVEAISGAGFANVVMAMTDGADTLDLTDQTVSDIAYIDLGSGDDSFIGSIGDDVVQGGTGDDHLSGSEGDDIYRYAIGDGEDVIADYSAGTYVDGGQDELQLGDGIATDDVTIVRNGDDALLSFAQGGTITLAGQFGSDPRSIIEQIRFADGSTWSASDIASLAIIPGTAGDDTMTLAQNGQIVQPGTGDDHLLVSGTGADTILFAKGNGHDRLTNTGSGYDRDDMLRLTDINPSEVSLTRAGDALLVAMPSTGDSFNIDYQFWGDTRNQKEGISYLKFADGTVWDRSAIRVNAVIRGTAGNDSVGLPATEFTVDTGTGDDSLSVSGNGSGTIVFAKGDGHDTLTNPGSGYDRDDTLVLQDIDPSEITLTRSGDALLITVPSTSDSFDIDYQFWGDTRGQKQGVSYVKFADGTVWDRDEIRDQADGTTSQALSETSDFTFASTSQGQAQSEQLVSVQPVTAFAPSEAASRPDRKSAGPRNMLGHVPKAMLLPNVQAWAEQMTQASAMFGVPSSTDDIVLKAPRHTLGSIGYLSVPSATLHPYR